VSTNIALLVRPRGTGELGSRDIVHHLYGQAFGLVRSAGRTTLVSIKAPSHLPPISTMPLPSPFTTTAAVENPTTRAQAEARAAVTATLSTAGSHHDSQFQHRASALHTNAAALARQESEVKALSAALAKESAKWQKELDKTTKGLNHFGDLQNWAEVVEREFLVLEETLRLAEGGQALESASGGSQWR